MGSDGWDGAGELDEPEGRMLDAENSVEALSRVARDGVFETSDGGLVRVGVSDRVLAHAALLVGGMLGALVASVTNPSTEPEPESEGGSPDTEPLL